MSRLFWIAGLSFAVLFYGAWTILIVYAGITHRHLNSTGLVMLVSHGYVAWITLRYLLQKIKDGGPASDMQSDSN